MTSESLAARLARQGTTPFSAPLTAREARERGGPESRPKGTGTNASALEGDASAAGIHVDASKLKSIEQNLSTKEMMKAQKAKEFELKLEKLRKLREQDAERIKERFARQQRLKDHQTELMVREILSENGLKAEAGKLVEEYDTRMHDRKQALYGRWDAEVAQRVEHQVMKYLNSTPLQAPEHFKGRELLHPGDDPLKSLIRQANEEEAFRKATEFVLLHSPQQGNLKEEVKRRDAIQDAVSRRENTRPMLPVPLWEQRQHYASNLGRFCQSCERGGSHRSAKRMGEGVHFVEESDGILAAGKTKTKHEKNRLGILEGTVAKEGESKNYKRPDGHSSGAPCQDHYFYERGNEAVQREMPLGKRLYPILKKRGAPLRSQVQVEPI